MSDKLEKLRLLAVDMDGTALLPDARVTPSTLAALKRVMEEGALVIPASGRVFGGIPEEILVRHPDECIRIPMLGETRSLNLANSVAIVLYEALRQQDFADLRRTGELHRLQW